jgi:hypothetical protein
MHGPPKKPSSSLFLAIDIEILLPQNHLLRRIDKGLYLTLRRVSCEFAV